MFLGGMGERRMIIITIPFSGGRRLHRPLQRLHCLQSLSSARPLPEHDEDELVRLLKTEKGLHTTKQCCERGESSGTRGTFSACRIGPSEFELPPSLPGSRALYHSGTPPTPRRQRRIAAKRTRNTEDMGEIKFWDFPSRLMCHFVYTFRRLLYPSHSLVGLFEPSWRGTFAPCVGLKYASGNGL